MIPSNQAMQNSDWKQRCEAALLTIATLTVKWSGERAERKRLTHAMFKVDSALDMARVCLEGHDRETALVHLYEAIGRCSFNSAGVGKKAAKREGLDIR